MKKYKKKELQNVIDTFRKVNNLIGKEGKGQETALDTLSQCQQTAIIIGSYMETQGTVGENIIHVLEAYCESLYQMNKVLQDTNKRYAIAEVICGQLNELETMIDNELPEDKRTIAFFVYKASMWDSLESIWKEAVTDVQCETYVIPIPYFDRNADRTLGEMHYEGGELPADIPITDWKNLVLEEMQLDVAYIHNPYDDFNKVTCVYPRFFASNLKKYVKTLVYVPYFATMNYVEEHFCVLPGVLYSDAVIVQTENVKRSYLETIEKFERENGLNNVFSANKDKFCVFGSPKFDKVLNMQMNDFVIPETWRKKIWKEDGTKRKVVLFNTSVQELILHGEAQVDKIQKAITLFKERQDIVLLWRPHPLNESTVKTMMPQLLDKYVRLEQDFRMYANGIFDDTADLHRAIAISDAYYGTGGSLIPLFGLTGKPILKENLKLETLSDNLKKRYVSFSGAYVDKTGSLWFCATDFNGLFRYDIEKDKLSFMGSFPEESVGRRYCYSSCVLYEDKLFFPPYMANEIAVFNMEKSVFEKISVRDYGIAGQKTYGVAQYKNKLLCFGGRMPAVLCLNMDTYEVEYYEALHTELEQYFLNDEATIINRDVIVEENVCWLSCGRANVVVEFHMDSMNYRIYRVGNCENYYAGMRKFDDKFYLFPRNAANVVCWDYKNNLEYEIPTLHQEACVANAYSNTCVVGEELWLFAYLGQYIGKIRKGTDAIELVEDMSDYEKDDIFCENACTFTEQKISWAYSDESYLYYFSNMDQALYIRDLQNNKIEKRHLKMSEADFYKARNLPMWDDREIKENVWQFVNQERTDTTLADYLDWVRRSDNLCSKNQKEVFLAELAEGHANCGNLCHEKFDLKE